MTGADAVSGKALVRAGCSIAISNLNVFLVLFEELFNLGEFVNRRIQRLLEGAVVHVDLFGQEPRQHL